MSFASYTDAILSALQFNPKANDAIARKQEILDGAKKAEQIPQGQPGKIKPGDMNKSVIILISIIWLLCSVYYTLARINGLPYEQFAMAGTWVASLLLLVCIVVYIKKHKDNSKQ